MKSIILLLYYICNFTSYPRISIILSSYNKFRNLIIFFLLQLNKEEKKKRILLICEFSEGKNLLDLTHVRNIVAEPPEARN